MLEKAAPVVVCCWGLKGQREEEEGDQPEPGRKESQIIDDDDAREDNDVQAGRSRGGTTYRDD